MSCEHLVCASCAGPVAEGRCPTCRAARMEHHSHGLTLSPEMLVFLIAILAVISLVLTHVNR